MLVARERILSEIRRLALENGGNPPGGQAFRSATGIGESAWKGRYWVNWGQALTEAGYAPNVWKEPTDNDVLVVRLADYMRELGRFPVDAELVMKRRSDPQFPSPKVFYHRFGSLQAVADAVMRHAREHGDAVVAAICESRTAGRVRKLPKQTADARPIIGSVYLMKSGAFYKIGLSNSSGRREYELGILLPERISLVHEIKTDCPPALESYWHSRFADKRKNGEWFELNAKDVAIFRKRKTFNFGAYF